MIEDVFESAKGEVGVVLYSVTGRKIMNGRPVTLAEGVLRSKNKNWVKRRTEVNKALRSVLRRQAALEPVMHFFRASNVTAYHCILASLLHGVWTTWVANRNSPNEGLPEANQGKSGCKVRNRL